MNKQTETALKMAIGQLSEYRESQVICAMNLGFKAKYATDSIDRAINACKEALEQPAQEPVATLKITSLGEYDLTLNVPTELHYKALIDAVGIGNHSLFIDDSQSSIGGCCNCKASKGIIGSSTFCDPHPATSWQALKEKNT